MFEAPVDLLDLSSRLPPGQVATEALRHLRKHPQGVVRFGPDGRYLMTLDPLQRGVILADSEESLTSGQRLPPFTGKVRRWTVGGQVRQVRTPRHNFAYLWVPEAQLGRLGDILSALAVHGRLPEGASRARTA